MRKELKERMKVLNRGRKHGGIYQIPPENGKKKQPKIRAKDYYEITLANFQFHLYQSIEMINNIDIDTFVYANEEVTVLNGNLKINDNFKKISYLDWRTPMPIDSLTFRGRFASLLLLKIARNAHRIVKGLYHAAEISGKRYRSYYALLDELIFEVDLFVAGFLSSDVSYTEHLINIYRLLLIAEEKDLEVIDRLEQTRNMLKEAASHRSDCDDGTICNNLLKMTYVLSTDSLKLKHTPRYEEELDFREDAMMVNQIGTLGFAIMKRRAKTEEVPIFYQVFQDAMPEILSRFNCENAPEIAIGEKAITLLELFLGDYKITKYIESYVK